MGLLDTADGGEYYIDGELVSAMNADERAQIEVAVSGSFFRRLI